MTDSNDSSQCCDIKEHLAVMGCCGSGTMRRFYTSREKIERLETYRETLENELAGVKEAIKDIKK